MPDQRFCGQCGANLAQACPACSAENPLAHRFCAACGAKLDQPTDGASPVAEERRWATVLFADLSGFTSLSESMDAEDVKDLAHRCAERLGEEVQRFGGTVIDVMGDSIMAVFGAPLAHEDDAERAVRAGLAMRDCSLVDPTGAQIQLHVGINTGEVMAGQIGPRERRQYPVMGDTTNIAARLMSAAPPATVLVGEETYRATHRLVRYRDVGPIEVRGKDQPLLAFEALDVALVPEARPLRTAPLVGRDEELSLLSGLWTKVAREARPHLVTIVGEPGIGKSRLVAEFECRALGEALVLHGRCLPYGEVLGYWALAMALKEAASITAEDDAAGARDKLGRLTLELFETAGMEADPSDVARHLALLSGLDTETDRAASTADQRTLHASVRRFLEALARVRPLCLLLEDIHWADDALLDLIEFVASRAQDAPLLIVAQARPELLEKRSVWGRGVRAFTSIPLELLDEQTGRDLVLALGREHGLSADLVEQIGRGAGGNPLFAEELVAMVAERGATSGIPSAIKALISARLDSLPAQERSALQRAAVFGKVFWEGGVRALGTQGDLAEIFEALEIRDLLRSQSRSRFLNEREYAFKHDLIRDVAYETLPRVERRSLHGRAADWMEQAAGERVEERLDVLAYHAVQADQPERALGYLSRAAERARRAAAHREEAALLAQAVAIAERLGQRDLVADLQARRGRAFADVAMWAEARPELESALEGLAPEDVDRQGEVLADLCEVCFLSQDTPSLRRHASESLALAERIGRGDLATWAMGWLAGADSADGDIASSVGKYQRALERAGGLGISPLAPALIQHSLLLYWTGHVTEAVERSRQAVDSARSQNNTSLTMWGYPHLGLALVGSGQYDEAVRVFDEARRFGREYGVWPFLARSISMSAGFHLDLFDYAGNEVLAEEARELGREHFMPTVVSAGIDLLLNYARRQEVSRAEKIIEEVAESVGKGSGWHGWLWKLRFAEARAEAALARGDSEEALRLATDAIDQSRAKGRPKYQALGLTTRAQALGSLGRTKAAIADLRSAVHVVRPVGDPAMFLRAAAALLAIDGDDLLAAEARSSVAQITQALPDDEMRRCFEAAEPVRLVARLTG